MIIKQRTVPNKLMILRYLDNRMKLLEVDRLEIWRKDIPENCSGIPCWLMGYHPSVI